jgi:hypothetical protein
MAMPADNKPNTPISDAVGDSWREIIRAANVPDVADEAMIPIEKPTGLHRYVVRYMDLKVPSDVVYRHIHQQQWSVITFEEGSNGTERLEWRDVPLVEEDVDTSDIPEASADWFNKAILTGVGWTKTTLIDGDDVRPGGYETFESKEAMDVYVAERIASVDASLAKQLQTSMERNASLIGELRKLQDIIDGQAERILKMEEALEWIFSNPEAHWATTAMIAEKGLGRNR